MGVPFDGSLALAVPLKPLITASEIEAIDQERILRAANEYLSQPPITITAYSSPRSKGGKHDYFSEGDYWWPDPKNPERPLHPPRWIFRSRRISTIIARR